MKAVGVIPVRWGSKRLPGKSLLDIAGRPLVEWVVRNAQRAERLDQLVVATDDERVAGAVETLGVRVVMTETAHPSGTDRCAEAVAEIDADIVVNIQGDEVLLEPGTVDRLVDALDRGPDWDMVTAATPIREESELQDPSAVKVVWSRSGRALYFSRSPIPLVRDAGEDAPAGIHWRHLGVYAYRRAFLKRFALTPPCEAERAEKLEQLRALHMDGRILVLETDEPGIGVDTPGDVKYAEKVLTERMARGE